MSNISRQSVWQNSVNLITYLCEQSWQYSTGTYLFQLFFINFFFQWYNLIIRFIFNIFCLRERYLPGTFPIYYIIWFIHCDINNAFYVSAISSYPFPPYISDGCWMYWIYSDMVWFLLTFNCSTIFHVLQFLLNLKIFIHKLCFSLVLFLHIHVSTCTAIK